MAVETPTMLPVPTREAVETMSAWNEETFPDPLGFSETARMASGNRRIWTNRVRIVNHTAVRERSTSRTG